MLQSFLREDIRGKSMQASRNRAEGLLASRVVDFGALHISRRGADRPGGVTGTDEGRGVSAGARVVVIGAEAGVDRTQAIVVGVHADARSHAGRVTNARSRATRHTRRGRKRAGEHEGNETHPVSTNEGPSGQAAYWPHELRYPRELRLAVDATPETGTSAAKIWRIAAARSEQTLDPAGQLESVNERP